jgi:hypothetical protein
VYEFTLHQEGTYFYHSHMAMQEMMGMLGAFIMHPKQSYRRWLTRTFSLRCRSMPCCRTMSCRIR